MKHKHYDMIIAWAEGEEIQFNLAGSEWHDIRDRSVCPTFKESYQYRIKPKEVVTYMEVHQVACQYLVGPKTSNLELTWLDHKLVKATVIK